jgi:hypothetical protein
VTTRTAMKAEVYFVFVGIAALFGGLVGAHLAGL